MNKAHALLSTPEVRCQESPTKVALGNKLQAFDPNAVSMVCARSNPKALPSFTMGRSNGQRAPCTLRFRRGDSSTYQNRPKMKLSTAVLLPTEDLDWSAPRRDYPTDMLLHQLFETQAAKTPEATAVVYEDQTLSYRQLDQAADALACRLHAAGVGPGALVALLCQS